MSAEQEDFKISGRIVDVVAGEIFPGTVEVVQGRIADIQRETSVGSVGYQGPLADRFIMPGFVDAHVHVESSMLTPAQFARLAVRQGTVAAVSDPHEIANVLGVPGVEFMLRDGAAAPFTFAFGAPSCVPATPFESSGAYLGPEEVDALLARDDIYYLSEMMNFPGVIHGDPEVAAKIAAAKRHGKPIDGHAPGVRGEELVAYVNAGISTDHESLSYAEAEEKIRLGMKILIRDGSAAHEFDLLYPLMQSYPEQCMLCSDDKHPQHLVKGHINVLAARAVAAGIDPLTVIRCACLNPVRHYGLDVGLLQPGDPADFIVVADLEDFDAIGTYVKGRLVSADGTPLFAADCAERPNRFAAREQRAEVFAVTARPGRINVIEALDGQLVTRKLVVTPTVRNGQVVSDTDRDILKIVVLNRYQEAPPAVAFIRNVGLQRGAMASSVAHDSHNIVAVGTSDEELAAAVNEVIRNRGGLAVAVQENVRSLPLPIAGLMSPLDGLDVAEIYDALDRAAKDLGSRLSAPFMTLSFMALLVIPSLKISDVGLFNAEAFKGVNLFVD
ncbi:MAG: adenine deaminase [Actinobacteria bacterium]|nr:adenine deaminase [Actinomycetota bacterium]